MFLTKKKKKRMLDYWLDRKHYAAQFSGLTLIYISDKEHVVFLSFWWTYNFSCQITQSQGDMRLEIYPYLEYRRFLPSQFFLQQTTKTLVSLLSFKVDLMLKNIIGNGKILFQNMQVLLIIQMRCNLSTCTLLRNSP